MRRTKIIGVVLLLGTALAAPQRSLASWPGRNGRIVFDRTTENPKHSLFSVTRGGEHETRLTDSHRGECCPSYSPSGEFIAYLRNGSEKGDAIVRMKLDGTKKRRLFHTRPNLESPSWSFNGTKILFWQRKGNNDACDWCVFKMNRDGSNLKRIDLGGRVFDPLWSPDGDRISFMRQETQVYSGGIYTADPDGSDQKLVLEGDERDLPTGVGWSPDGDQFVFWCHQDSRRGYALCIMNEDGSDIFRQYYIAGQKRFNYEFHTPDWSPDGKRVILWGDNRFFSMKPGESDLNQIFRVPRGETLREGSWQPRL